jgi:hypothetical protein
VEDEEVRSQPLTLRHCPRHPPLRDSVLAGEEPRLRRSSRQQQQLAARTAASAAEAAAAATANAAAAAESNRRRQRNYRERQAEAGRPATAAAARRQEAADRAQRSGPNSARQPNFNESQLPPSERSNLGNRTAQCSACHAIMWPFETHNSSGAFSLCCCKGKVWAGRGHACPRLLHRHAPQTADLLPRHTICKVLLLLHTPGR